MKYLVIDTNLWHKAFNDYSSDAMSILHLIKMSASLGVSLDHEQKVLSEYGKQSCAEFIRRWIYSVFCSTPSKLGHYSSALDFTIQNNLQQLGFEIDDMPFVGLTINSDKIIITEDSDYGKGNERRAQEICKQNVLCYLTMLELTIFDYSEAMQKIRQNEV